MKKPSSVLQYYGDLPNVGSLIYAAIPFAIELRCIFDYTLSKTSLDHFQFMQLFQYHLEIYNARNGNNYYAIKKFGGLTEKLDKCTFGVTILSILIFLLVGPMLLFSEYGGLTSANPVLNGELTASFLIQKAVYTDVNDHRMRPGLTEAEARKIEDEIESGVPNLVKVNTAVPYQVYKNSHSFLRTYDEDYWKTAKYFNWTETRSFKPSQVQECMFTRSPDATWAISGRRKAELSRDVGKALNRVQPNLIANVSLALDFALTRDLPETAKVAGGRVIKDLDYTFRPDCLTGKQLRVMMDFDCNSNPLNEDGSPKKGSATFSQALNPNYILGQTDKFAEISRETQSNET